jgi:hypothetical protein
VWVGDVAQWLCAVGAAWYWWSRAVTVESFAVAMLACAVCQAGAVAAVVWPGRAAGQPEIVDHHRGVTVAIVCLSLIFGLCLGLPIVDKVLDQPDQPLAALFMAGNALVLTSFFGLCAATALSSRRSRGSSEQLPAGSGWADAGDSVSVDD